MVSHVRVQRKTGANTMRKRKLDIRCIPGIRSLEEQEREMSWVLCKKTVSVSSMNKVHTAVRRPPMLVREMRVLRLACDVTMPGTNRQQKHYKSRTQHRRNKRGNTKVVQTLPRGDEEYDDRKMMQMDVYPRKTRGPQDNRWKETVGGKKE